MKPLLLASALLGLWVNSSLAQLLVPRSSEEFTDYLAGRSYEGNVLPPANTGAAFVRKASGTISQESVAGGNLTFKTPVSGGGQTLSWQVGSLLPAGGTSETWWTDNVSPTKGFTVEFRLQALPSEVVEGSTVDYRFNFIASYNTATSDSQVLAISGNQVLWGATVLSTANNSSDFHVYRLVREANANTYQLWRDDVQIGVDLAGSITAQNRFWFGDWGGQPGGGVLDFLRWDTSGAYAPVPEPSAAALLLLAGAGIAFLRRRNG